jgi:hypothetical protein
VVCVPTPMSSSNTNNPAPSTVNVDGTCGAMTLSKLEVQDVTSVRALFSPNDDTKRDLALATNANSGSTITLGTWSPTTNTIVPTVTLSSTAVTSTKPIQAPTLTDGSAVLTRGNLTSTSVSAGTVTGTTVSDGKGARLNNGALTAASATVGNITATSTLTGAVITDGVAQLSGGVLSGVTLGSLPELIIGPWKITVIDSKLVLAVTTDGGKTYTPKHRFVG